MGSPRLLLWHDLPSDDGPRFRPRRCLPRGLTVQNPLHSHRGLDSWDSDRSKASGGFGMTPRPVGRIYLVRNAFPIRIAVILKDPAKHVFSQRRQRLTHANWYPPYAVRILRVPYLVFRNENRPTGTVEDPPCRRRLVYEARTHIREGEGHLCSYAPMHLPIVAPTRNRDITTGYFS